MFAATFVAIYPATSNLLGLDPKALVFPNSGFKIITEKVIFLSDSLLDWAQKHH